jgi:hypothetical protein
MKTTKKKNKELIAEYPFLLPRNRFTGEVDLDYNYAYTELDAMPEGWRKAFGEQMCKEIKNALGKNLNNYRIMQIKEKFGSLRWYDNGATEKVNRIISKYEILSAVTCIECGEPATRVTKGWISPFCDNHFPRPYVNGELESTDYFYKVKNGKILWNEKGKKK